MKSKELSLPLKQDIIRLKNENKPIREIAKTLGVAKSTIWYILKKERNGQLRNYQRTGRPRVTSVVDDRRILALLEKNPLTTVDQIKNTLQELGVFVSKSTIKRRVQQSRCRGFTRRFTPALEPAQGTTEKGTCTEELQTGSNCKVEATEGECSDPAAESDKPDVAEEVEVSSAPTQQSPASAEVVEGDYPNQNEDEGDYANQNETEQDCASQNEDEQDYANQNEDEQDCTDQNEAEPDKVDQIEDDVEHGQVAMELSLETSSEVTMPSQDPPPPSEPAQLPPADDWSPELPTDDLFTVPMSQTSSWGGTKDWS